MTDREAIDFQLGFKNIQKILTTIFSIQYHLHYKDSKSSKTNI